MDNHEVNQGKRGGIFSFVKEELALRREDKTALLLDILIFSLSFFFAKRHIAFGAYPLGIALVGVMNRRVLISALGAVVGALTLGSLGVVYAIMIPLVVILRLVLGNGNTAFSEPYVIRVFSVAIASSLISLYELLVSGPTLNATLFSCVGILLSIGIAISLFGAFTQEITYKDIIYSFPLEIRRGGEIAPGIVFYHASMLLLILLATLSLDGYSFFGITLSYIFLSAVTLFTSVRFGAARGMLVGFVGGLVLGGVSAVGFSIAGLVTALLSKIGAGYAVIGGALALGAWCGYVGGISGFLSAFPEYSITSILMLPFIRYNALREKASYTEVAAEEDSPIFSLILEKIKCRGNDSIAERIRGLSSSVSRFSSGGGNLEFSEYRNIILAATSEMSPNPCEEKIDALASKFYKGDKLTARDIVKVLGDGCDEVANRILRLSASYERECFMNARQTGLVGEYDRLIRLLSEREGRCESAVIEDKELSKILSELLLHHNVEYKKAVVVGECEKNIIIITSEQGYERISDKALHKAISERLGRAILDIKCEKIYNAATLTAKIAPLFMVEYGIRTKGGNMTGVCGDTARTLIYDNNLYAVLSDGVGRGESASLISSFITDYLLSSLTADAGNATQIISSLSAILRTGRGEASGTADIMSVNLYTGKGYFVKCGAISSFIKRGSEIIEICGGGTPAGLAVTPLVECTDVDLTFGDLIVMVSDGAAADGDMEYLREYLKNPVTDSAEGYATALLNLATSSSSSEDDITAMVINILPYS